jgi:hypothetical protein
MYIIKFLSNKVYNNKIYTQNGTYKLCHTGWKISEDLTTVVFLRSFVFVHVA